jgi:hypothetical protein
MKSFGGVVQIRTVRIKLMKNLGEEKKEATNDAPLLCPAHHTVQGGAAGSDFRTIPTGF